MSPFGPGTRPWVEQGGDANYLYAAWGDGDPKPAAQHLILSSLLVNRDSLTSGSARSSSFQLPRPLTVSAVRVPTRAGATGSPYARFCVYRAEDGAKMWEADLTTLVDGFASITAGTPFTLTEGRRYWMCVTAVGTGTADFLYLAKGPPETGFYGADASPLGGRQIGMPAQVRISLSTASTFPATMPAINATVLGTPIALFEGTVQ